MILSDKTKSVIFSVSAVLLWSTVATAFKITLEGMSFAQLLFYSSFFSTIVLFIIAMTTKKERIRKEFTGKNFTKNIVLGALNPFLYYLVLFKAYSLLPAQQAQPLNYTWPIAIAVFSVIFLKQKLSVRTVVGLIIAFLGVYLIASKGNIFAFDISDTWGIILAVGSSIIWAAFWTLNLLDKRDNSIKLFGGFYFGTILSGIYILFFDTFKVNYYYLFGALYIGLFEMGITFFLWMKGMEFSKDKAKTSTLAYLSPFISFLFISLILKEQILISSIIGLIFIIGGIIYQQTEKS
ncbi:MAG TPA: EamA family transporter [Melioribacteraceae bacterium]|nr:EamA family transporter [Melioribacteraceae bacterium]